MCCEGQARADSDPRPSCFLGSWATPGAWRPAPVDIARAALPHGHQPRQPLRYAPPLPAPWAAPGDERGSPGPAGLQEEEALPGQPRLRGVVNSDGAQALP